MLYKDLDRKWKLSISGSINNAIKNISSDSDFDFTYDYWCKEKFEEAEGRIQFVKIITDERLDMDEELLCDIKKVKRVDYP